MVTGEILLGIPYYWYYRHYTTPTSYLLYSLCTDSLLLAPSVYPWIILEVSRTVQGIGSVWLWVVS